MKKFLSVVLILCFMLSMSISAFAEEVSVATGDETAIQNAVEAAGAAGTVKVDASITSGGTIVDEDITIDLGENTLEIEKPAVGSEGTKTLGFQLLDGNVVISGDEGAKIVFDGKSTETDDGNVALKMGIQNYTDLTLDNVTVDGSDLSNYKGATNVFDAEYVNYVVSNNSGSLTVTNGADIIAADGDIAFDVFVDGTYYPSDVPQVTITESAGTIDGTVEIDGRDLDKVTGEQAALNIEGGIFENFAIQFTDAVKGLVDKIINITGGKFNFNDDYAAEGYTVVNTSEGLKAYIDTDTYEIVADGDYYVVRVITPPTPENPEPVVEYYYVPAPAPVVEAEVVSAAPVEVEVNGEKLEVSISAEQVKVETAAPVAIADNKPAEVKVAVELAAVAESNEKAVEILKVLAESAVVAVEGGEDFDADSYELVVGDNGEVSIKLSAELLKTLGAGEHTIVVEFAGMVIEFVITIE